MVSGSRKDNFVNDGETDDLDRQVRSLHDDAEEETADVGRSGSPGPSDADRRERGISLGLREGIRDILRDGGDGDLVVEQNVENGILWWLRALDLQVLGACRADERLKPLLKLNVSSGIAEDRLIAQLSQHFEVSEVGMLARCLCVPLVSIRVGKVNKQGNLLCPTAIRGHLNLTLLPSSDMRLWFAGDDGCNERLALVGYNSESSEMILEEIDADSSGRSFLLKLPSNRVAYFWCSERSMLLGTELLRKMRDLLQRNPSLSQLTGICEARLDSFASHLRAYLLGSTNFADANIVASSPTFPSIASSSHESDTSNQPSSKISRSPCFGFITSDEPGEADSLDQGNLSLISNAPQDGGAREKSRDGHFSFLTMNNAPLTTSTSSYETRSLSPNQTDDNKVQEGRNQITSFCLPELPCQSSPSLPLSFHLPPSQVSSLSSSLFSPYYCWCPCTSSLQYTVTPPHLPSASSEFMPLPPLSTLLSDGLSPVSFVSSQSLDLSQLPTLELPVLLPEQLVRFPTPVSSFVTMPSSQQIPTFTPFMSDPIVHIPVIDICSAGQGYLVSAGPAISSAIPPLVPNLVKPLMPESELVVEKNARETLRMLMASAPTCSQMINMGSAVLTSINENFSYVQAKKRGAAVAGSRGLYIGAQDANRCENDTVVQYDMQEQSNRCEIPEVGSSDEDDMPLD